MSTTKFNCPQLPLASGGDVSEGDRWLACCPVPAGHVSTASSQQSAVHEVKRSWQALSGRQLVRVVWGSSLFRGWGAEKMGGGGGGGGRALQVLLANGAAFSGDSLECRWLAHEVVLSGLIHSSSQLCS